MANLQIQDSFEPYYAGRDANGWQGDANDNRPTAQQADQNTPQRRRQLELASRRLAMLARRNGAREK
jgi:hypothetical protein